MARPVLALVLLCVGLLAVQIALAADASARRSRHQLRAEATVNTRVWDRVFLGIRDSSESMLQQLPEVKDSVIQVYYLEAPLFKQKYGNAGAAFNLFHGGVGFCVGEDGKCKQEFAVEYNAKNGVFATLFPVMEGDNVKFNADNTVVWANDAEQIPLSSIDMSYWTSKRRVATIDAALYAKVRSFIQGDIKNFPRYKLFYVKGPNADEVHSESSTCVDFVWRVLGFLAKNGICLKSAVGADIPRRDYVVVTNSKAKTVLEVVSNRAKIASFYKKGSKQFTNFKTQVERLSAVKNTDPRAIRRTATSAVSKLSDAVKKMSDPKGLFYVYEDEKNVQEIQLRMGDAVPVKLEYEQQTGKSYSPFADEEKNCK